jgi:histidine triad (HIT) family protein
MVADCVFCKIVGGKSHTHKVYETKNFLAFLDIRPLNPGHTVVITKRHYRWVWDVPEIGEYFEVCQKLAKALKKTFNTERIFSVILGEAIPHAHIHLIPRFENDGHGLAINFESVKSIYDSELKKLAEQIREKL